jgi:hypothetical protein
MRSRGSLKKLTFVMMGMCVFYGATAFRMPVQANSVPDSMRLILSALGIVGVIAGTVTALLTGVMLPPNIVKTRLIISLALMELCAVQGFVLRMTGAQPSSVWMLFAIPLATIAIFVLPRALTHPD